MNEPSIVFSLNNQDSDSCQLEITILKNIPKQKVKVLTISCDNNLKTNIDLLQKQIIKHIEEKYYIYIYDTEIVKELKKIANIDISLLKLISVKELLIIFFPNINISNINQISSYFNIKTETKNCPEGDSKVEIIWKVIKKCWDKGLSLGLLNLNKLHKITSGLSSQLFIELLQKEVQSRYLAGDYNFSYNHYEYSYSLFKINQEPTSEEIELSQKWVIDFFSKDGLLSKNLANFEIRSSQISMVKAITKGFTESINTVIEAGTGTGKSISYLIPALWWAKKTNQKVIIATHTINLQEQLFSKDLPFLEKFLPFSFKTQIIKGKGNYMCLKKFNHEISKNELTHKEKAIYSGVFIWSKETYTGDLLEVSEMQDFNLLKNKFNAENVDCQLKDCFFGKECFFIKTKKLAEKADIIITNHSLLLADIKTNNKIIPDYNYLIIDEAHNFYQTAITQLSFEVSLEKIDVLMNKILPVKNSLTYNIKQKELLASGVFPLLKWEDLDNYLEKMVEISRSVIEEAKQLFNIFTNIIGTRNNVRLNIKSTGSEKLLTVINITLENLLFRLNSIIELLDKISNIFSTHSQQFVELISEINKCKNGMAEITVGLKEIVNNEDEKMVTYLENNGVVYLKSVCIDIARILKNKLFNKKHCTILTSATLTVEDSFEYFTQNIGLENYNSFKFDSIFDFNKQILFSIVNNIPVKQLSENLLVKKSVCFIKRAVEITNGRTLVLFTSYRFLRLIYDELESYLSNRNIKLYAQGINGTREKILNNFISEPKSVLLGTNSFWEGIDIPGDNLKCVIITRLPFWPPDNPIIEARTNYLLNKGRKPFEELHLPEAIIRFKQGFGRLIRNKNNKGAIIVLDDRLLTKSYGKRFLNSLPINSYSQGDTDEVLKQIREWI